VQDSAESRAAAPGGPRGRSGPVPTEQRSPYGPKPPKEKVPEGTADEDETQR